MSLLFTICLVYLKKDDSLWLSSTVGWSVSYTPIREGFEFNSQSRNVLRLWVWSPIRERMGGNWSMFLFLSLLLLFLKLIKSYTQVKIKNTFKKDILTFLHHKFILGWKLCFWLRPLRLLPMAETAQYPFPWCRVVIGWWQPVQRPHIFPSCM